MATRIYTKTGDRGTTALFGGQRVPKHALRIECYGTVDEINSVLGVGLVLEKMTDQMHSILLELSNLLFTLGSDLATPLDPPPRWEIPRITEQHVTWLEQWIDRWEAELPPLNTFILPTGSMPAALLHHARTICRRAERRATELAEHEPIGDVVVPFLNRCSDFLFVAARVINKNLGRPDVAWSRHSA